MNPFSNEHMKNLLLRDKAFLKSLYEGPNPLKNKRVLISANDSQLNTLLKYLNSVCNGQIKIKKENFELISNAKKISSLKAIDSKKKLSEMLKSDRVLKLTFLKKFSNVYGPLLYILFNEV
jgi:bisphosphoglycerate-dependent phosphoglycerate mutase